jgi:peptidyl-prolyl cis-trans isomerase A (cyclophilin A)/peptidyl-prolyl cis-trans isomerase B (cyclophilin B)
MPNLFSPRRQAMRLLATLAFAAVSASAASLAFAAGAPQVLLKTSMGDMTLELNADKAPKSVENFLQYVNSGHYNGTIFHRVIDGFMIQGGGFDKNMVQKPTNPPIVNEAKNGLKNQPYTLAMARTSNPNSASSQFFINVADNKFLDYPGQDGAGYAVFGKVIKGMDVADKIRAVQTGRNDVPVKPVVIESATVLK